MKMNRTLTGPTSRKMVLLASLGAAVLLPGCGREERGPILSGGRGVKSWIADLHHAKAQVRRQAVLKLANAADTDPSVAEGLAEALNDPDALVRRDAIRAVTKLKQPSAAIRERLENMSRSDKDSRARDLARKVLDRTGGAE